MKKNRNHSPLREKIQQALCSNKNHSDRRIAKQVGTSHVTVGKVRREFPQYAQTETLGIDQVLRRRPSKGNLRELELAARRFEKAIQRFRGGLSNCQTSEQTQIINRFKKWIVIINKLAASLLE